MFPLSKRHFAVAAFAVCVLFAGAGHAQCPLASPTPVAPANGATQIASTVTFQWTAVPGATSYEVWATVVGYNSYAQLGTSTTTSLISELYSGIDVEWYVVAVNASCKSLESLHFRFSTAGCTGPSTDLIFPGDNDRVSSPVRFFWAVVPSAAYYRLWIARYENGQWQDWEIWDETYRTESRVFLEPRFYAWLVETVFDQCDSNYSYYNIFEVGRAANCSAEKPRIQTPPNGSSVKSPLTLTWSAVPGAINYEVWASLDNGQMEFVDETARNSMDVYVGYGHVQWFVVAQFNGCDDAISETASFDVAYDPACDHDAPFPIVPGYGVTNVPTKTDFVWTPVAGASRYNVWVSLNEGEAFKLGTVPGNTTRLTANVQAGEVFWAVEAEFDGCSPNLSPVSWFVAVNATACTPPAEPEIYISPAANSGDPYYVLWSPGLNTSSYELQESTDPNFGGANTRSINDVLVALTHQVSTPTRYYYRVRSKSSCDAGDGPYSQSASIVVQPVVAQTGDRAGTIAAYGTQQQVIQKIHIPGSGSSPNAAERGISQGFTATTDEPWLTVTPSSGTIPPEGIDLTVTGDPRRLAVGTNTATVRISTTASAGTPASVPVSISLVTPVSPDAGTSPLPNSLIIPGVAHAAGAGTTFESDVRITNTAAQTMKYLLNFTPTRTDGTKSGQQATIQVDANETMALNDILKNFFGFAGATDSMLGVLEIRPLSSVSSSNATQGNVTFASSRTFAVAKEGTYGQYIPAIPFSQFVGKDAKSGITLSQIANASGYRTNVGVVEASGEAATVHFTVRDAGGGVVSEFDKQLQAGEHQQFALPVAVENGRIEVNVTSSTGKVTAYASVVDNKTNDPMLIEPVNTASLSAQRYVLPGMAQTTGTNNWRSDVRLLNAGAAAAQAKIQFYEVGNPTPMEVTQTVQPGQMLVFDEALRSLFGKLNNIGALVVSTPSDSKLVASARTYNLTPTGTYGQFIPGITVNEGVGVTDRALQVLQVEKSDRFRTNLGLVELTGNPVTVQIAAYTPDSKVSTYISWPLGANEFVQINDILGRMNINNAYNARVSLKVIGGSGRISGYGSLIDNRTQDPTYVKAQ